MKTLLKILLTGIAVLLVPVILPSVTVVNYTTAIWVAAVLALLNTFIKPVLLVLTLPVTIVSLGLFVFVINAAIILMASSLVDGFHVPGFFTALLFSFILWVFRTLLFSLIKEDEQNTWNRTR
ncbi:phage holin family protein [Flavicella sediminum]|uniref:phage holin family protein n=1 Tax=Flavicella sediminum TaxID=2585141 RepID=UPI00111DA0B7|nr:phage holin family protein [Flavicella sediminum]